MSFGVSKMNSQDRCFDDEHRRQRVFVPPSLQNGLQCRWASLIPDLRLEAKDYADTEYNVDCVVLDTKGG